MTSPGYFPKATGDYVGLQDYNYIRGVVFTAAARINMATSSPYLSSIQTVLANEHWNVLRQDIYTIAARLGITTNLTVKSAGEPIYAADINAYLAAADSLFVETFPPTVGGVGGGSHPVVADNPDQTPLDPEDWDPGWIPHHDGDPPPDSGPIVVGIQDNTDEANNVRTVVITYDDGSYTTIIVNPQEGTIVETCFTGPELNATTMCTFPNSTNVVVVTPVDNSNREVASVVSYTVVGADGVTSINTITTTVNGDVKVTSDPQNAPITNTVINASALGVTVDGGAIMGPPQIISVVNGLDTMMTNLANGISIQTMSPTPISPTIVGSYSEASADGTTKNMVTMYSNGDVSTTSVNLSTGAALTTTTVNGVTGTTTTTTVLGSPLNSVSLTAIPGTPLSVVSLALTNGDAAAVAVSPVGTISVNTDATSGPVTITRGLTVNPGPAGTQTTASNDGAGTTTTTVHNPTSGATSVATTNVLGVQTGAVSTDGSGNTTVVTNNPVTGGLVSSTTTDSGGNVTSVTTVSGAVTSVTNVSGGVAVTTQTDSSSGAVTTTTNDSNTGVTSTTTTNSDGSSSSTTNTGTTTTTTVNNSDGSSSTSTVNNTTGQVISSSETDSSGNTTDTTPPPPPPPPADADADADADTTPPPPPADADADTTPPPPPPPADSDSDAAPPPPPPSDSDSDSSPSPSPSDGDGS